MAVVVDYNTIPATGDTTAEKMAVLALTSLIYDGVTDRNVWNSVINNYLAHKLPLIKYGTNKIANNSLNTRLSFGD